MIQLLHGDCLTLMKEVEPGSVDLVLCDPPYSSGGTHAGDRKANTTAKYTDRDFDGLQGCQRSPVTTWTSGASRPSCDGCAAS